MQPQAHLVYTAQKVTSTFSQGKFEQELHGKAYLGNFIAAAAAAEKANGRQASATGDVSPGSRQALLDANGDVTSASEADPNRWGSEPDSPSSTTPADQNDTSQPSPQSAAPASPPTSNGEVISSSAASDSENATTSSPTQTMAADDDATDN